MVGGGGGGGGACSKLGGGIFGVCHGGGIARDGADWGGGWLFGGIMFDPGGLGDGGVAGLHGGGGKVFGINCGGVGIMLCSSLGGGAMTARGAI